MEDLNNWREKFEVCIYTKKLLDKVEYLNNVPRGPQILVDINEVKKAVYYARKYHGNQKRYSGEPFYSHPIEVACMVADYLFRTDTIVTAILHDTIEDTILTKENIAGIFGEQIANQVEDLTRIKEKCIKIGSIEIVEMLYQERKYDILLIKLLDRLHNLQTISARSPEKITKTLTETLKRFITLSIYLDNRVHKALKIEEIITELCYRNLPVTQHTLQDLELNFNDGYQHPFPIVQNDIIHNYIQRILES